MTSKNVMAGGPVLLGVLIAATEYMAWNSSLHYLWALAAVAWGVGAYVK